MFTSQHRLLLTASVLLGTVLGLSSCYENTPAANTSPIPQQSAIQLTATLNGAQEKPQPVTSPGSGTFTATIDRTTRVMNYTVVYTGISPVAGHLHRITETNGTGPVTIPFTSLTSPIIGTTTLPTQARVDSLSGGFYYANLHTSANPSGEIRGDIRVR